MSSSNYYNYLKALESPKIDTSDYILIVTQMLTEKLGSKIRSDILTLQEDYIHSDYEVAMSKINALLKRHAQDLDPHVAEELKAKQKVLEGNPMENQSRRYFETKFSNAIWNAHKKPEFSSLAKLSALMKEKNPRMTGLPSEVTNIKQAEKVIGDMREFGEKTEEILATETELRKPDYTIDKLKDRGGKRIDEKKDALYSLNPGIVRASSPMPADERLEKVSKNRVADMWNINREKEIGYSAVSTNVPFVNSVSGTVYTLAAVLKSYMEKYKDDPNLEQDVNNLVKSFVGFTNMKGYHSLAEMVDVLVNDPVVQKVFKEGNVTLNTHFLSESKIAETMKMAAEYSRQLNFQRTLTSELSSGIQLKKQTKLEQRSRKRSKVAMDAGSDDENRKRAVVTMYSESKPGNVDTSVATALQQQREKGGNFTPNRSR